MKKIYYLILVLIFSGQVSGQTIYALSGNDLISFNASSPDNILTSVTITGITAGQLIAGMDFRPATNELYVLGYKSSTGEACLYTMDIVNGKAKTVGATSIMLEIGMGDIGFDFNPADDRIRVIGANDASYSLHPATGDVVAKDGNLAYAVGDINQGKDPVVGSCAYNSNFMGLSNSVLYMFDNNLNSLTTLHEPAYGTIYTQGLLNITINFTAPVVDMDIHVDVANNKSIFYLAANNGMSTFDSLYTIVFDVGNNGPVLTPVGSIGRKIKDIAVMRAALPAMTGHLVYSISSRNFLISFDSDNPLVPRSYVEITGLAMGHYILGMDFRPATGELYALYYNAVTNLSQLYIMNPTTGIATAVGVADTLMLGTGKVAIDFNPVYDYIRVVGGSNDANYRLDPITGSKIKDGNLVYAHGDIHEGENPGTGGCAYTNNYKGAMVTTLYYFDQFLNTLATQHPPNTGVINTIGAAWADLHTNHPVTDMDIYFDRNGNNYAYLIGDGVFYSVDLISGLTTSIGHIGHHIWTIAVLPDTIVLSGIEKLSESNVLLQVSPNPANKIVYVNYELLQPGKIEILITDLTGRNVALINEGIKSGGQHETYCYICSEPGMHLVQIYIDGRLQQVKKLLIE